MAQQINGALPRNSFDGMVEEFEGDVNDMDVAMSQIETDLYQEENGGFSSENLGQEMLTEPLDDMDEVMSQIDTEIINQMEQEVDADIPLDIPAELLVEYHKAMDAILPNKSGNRYIQAFEVFKKWQASHETSSFDEKIVMAYFFEAGQKYKPSKLWSMYSMLKKMLICKHNVDIAKYCQLNAWLKNNAHGFESKQSNVFEPQEINKFVVEAPNSLYLAMKAVLAFGVTGACRHDEITKITVDKVKDTGKEFIVTIPDSQTKTTKRYIIDGEFANIIRQYIDLRPPNATSNRYFLQYRNGKCVNQVMGKNSIAKIPKVMATFLQLPDPKSYTGHSYRRTGTTIAADAGASIEDLKRLGPWKSTSVCERYIQDSLSHKRKLAHLITGAIDLPSISTAGITNDKKNSPKLSSVEPSTEFTVSGPTKSTPQTLDIFGIPESKGNVILNFGAECSNFTINYSK